LFQKNLKEWMVFMKEPAKNWWFFGQFFDCLNNLRTTIIHQNYLFENFENWQVSGDNRWASVPHPKNRPTLVGTPCWTDLSWLNSWPTRKLRTKKRITKLNKSLPGPQADASKRADYKSGGKKLRTYVAANYKFRVGEYGWNMWATWETWCGRGDGFRSVLLYK
jgi:hypothetical protein